MNIRPGTQEDWSYLADMWLRVSLQAHHFIDRTYWEVSKRDMEVMYLPQSQTYVGEHEGQIVGFISMVDDYLAALFIEEQYQSRGYGQQFVEFVKRDRESITLKVFAKNASAYRFYSKQGFVVEQELIDQDTNESEFVMIWRKDQ